MIVPVVWVREVGKGRVLYTSLGHNEAVWRSDWYQQHLAQSMKWLTGAAPGSAEPNPREFDREEKLARQAYEQAGGEQASREDVVATFAGPTTRPADAEPQHPATH